MLKFEPRQDPKQNYEKIVLNGNEIGEVWKMKFGYQCQIHVATGVTMNGINNTKEGAIKNAVESGKKEAAALIVRADELEKVFKQ